MGDPLLTAIENLSRFHREHEKFYAQAPREQAVIVQRHSRALCALADRWAERWGYVNRSLRDGDLRPFVDTLARRIARLSAESIALAKLAVDAAREDPTPGLLREGQLFRQSLRDPAASERMTAFMAAGGQTREVEREGFPGGF